MWWHHPKRARPTWPNEKIVCERLFAVVGEPMYRTESQTERELSGAVAVSDLVRQYIARHRCISRCLTRGIIHYAALARRVAAYYQIEAVDACKVACRRLAIALPQKENYEVDLRHEKIEFGTSDAIVALTFHREPRDLEVLPELISALAPVAEWAVIPAHDEVLVAIPHEKVALVVKIMRRAPHFTQENLSFLSASAGVSAKDGFWAVRMLAEWGVNIVAGCTLGSRQILIVDSAAARKIREGSIEEGESTASKISKRYLERNQSVREALTLGLVNYAILARIIANVSEGVTASAVASSLQRFAATRAREHSIDEELARGLSYSRSTVESRYAEVAFGIAQMEEVREILRTLSPSPAATRVVAGHFGIKILSNSSRLPLSSRPYERRVVVEIGARPHGTARAGMLDYLLFRLAASGVLPENSLMTQHRVSFVIRQEDLTDFMETLYPG